MLNPELLDLISGAGDGAWIVDQNQRIVFWNESAARALNIAPETAVGFACDQLIAGISKGGIPICQTHCPIHRQATDGKAVRAFDLVVTDLDGDRLLLSVSILAQNSPDDSDAYVVHLFRILGRLAPDANHLRIRLLGPTEVQRADGSLVTGKLWQRKKTRALLALLALQNGRGLHREQITETLWPENSYESALRNLNTTVYNLRRSLEPDLRRGADSHYILYESDVYLLAGGTGHWLDVEAFEKEIKQARRETDPHAAINLYRHALALYRGGFQADLGSIGAWPNGERERLFGLFLVGLEELGRLYEQQGQFGEAEDAFGRAFTSNPCRESACQALMRLSLQRQNTHAAIAYYRQLVTALQKELAARPTEATRRLYRQARDMI